MVVRAKAANLGAFLALAARVEDSDEITLALSFALYFFDPDRRDVANGTRRRSALRRWRDHLRPRRDGKADRLGERRYPVLHRSRRPERRVATRRGGCPGRRRARLARRAKDLVIAFARVAQPPSAVLGAVHRHLFVALVELVISPGRDLDTKHD